MPIITVVWRQVQKNQKFKVGAGEMVQLLNTRAPAGDLGSISSSLMAGPSSMALVQGGSDNLFRPPQKTCSHMHIYKHMQTNKN